MRFPVQPHQHVIPLHFYLSFLPVFIFTYLVDKKVVSHCGLNFQFPDHQLGWGDFFSHTDFLPTISIIRVFFFITFFCPFFLWAQVQMFWKDVARWLYFTIMKLSSHYLKHLIIHFYPDYCYYVFLGWMVLYWVYIWNSLYAQFSHPQLGNNLKVFYWKKCFMASSDAISTGL